MESEQATPSLSQAQRLKRFSQEDKLSPAVMSAILSEEKKVEREQLSFSTEALRKYFPKSYTPQQMEAVIFRLLDTWQRKRQQQER
jgi:ParB family chromosome partitioning protein